MTNLLIYSVGFAGVSKCTIALASSKPIELRIIDDHYANNPISRLVALDGVTLLPPTSWDYVLEFRHAALELVATSHPEIGISFSQLCFSMMRRASVP